MLDIIQTLAIIATWVLFLRYAKRQDHGGNSYDAR